MCLTLKNIHCGVQFIFKNKLCVITSVLQVSQTLKKSKQHAIKMYIEKGEELAGVRDIF